MYSGRLKLKRLVTKNQIQVLKTVYKLHLKIYFHVSTTYSQSLTPTAEKAVLFAHCIAWPCPSKYASVPQCWINGTISLSQGLVTYLSRVLFALRCILICWLTQHESEYCKYCFCLCSAYSVEQALSLLTIYNPLIENHRDVNTALRWIACIVQNRHA